MGGTAGTGGTGGVGLPPDILSGCTLLLHLDEEQWTGAPGEVQDASGFANHGTAMAGATTTNTPAKFGRAGWFDGQGYVSVKDDTLLRPSTALTIAAWFYATAEDGQGRGVVSKRHGYTEKDTFSLFTWDSDGTDEYRLHVDVDGSDERFFSNTVIARQTWYHAVVVYNGTWPETERVRLYINGVLDGAPHKEWSASIPSDYDAALEVGGLPNGGDPFVGAIDEVVMWRRDLSDAEVAALYAAGTPL